MAKKIEGLPISNPQNSQYTDRLLTILDRRVRKDPVLFVLYNNGRISGIGQSDKGVARLKSQAAANKKKRAFDRFDVYTLSDGAYLNDIEAIAGRMLSHNKAGVRNFAKAKNTTEEVKSDVRKWASSEERRVNRHLRPVERKYKTDIARLDRQEHHLRKRYAKRIEHARDQKRQRTLREERDKKITSLRVQRKRLAPLRSRIASLQAEVRSFQSVRL